MGMNIIEPTLFARNKFSGIKKGKKWENNPLDINLSESKQTIHDRNPEDIHDFTYEELKISEYIQPTTNGKWVNIQYELEVTCEMNGNCFFLFSKSNMLNFYVSSTSNSFII